MQRSFLSEVEALPGNVGGVSFPLSLCESSFRDADARSANAVEGGKKGKDGGCDGERL